MSEAAAVATTSQAPAQGGTTKKLVRRKPARKQASTRAKVLYDSHNRPNTVSIGRGRPGREEAARTNRPDL